MKVLLLRANPRKTGYTQRLTDLYVAGLRAEGAEVEEVELSSRRFELCDGCYHCWVATPGQCVHSDGMSELLERVLACEVLVCATPLYYYSMSASLKTFFERTFPLTAPGLVRSRAGLSRNRIRYPERWQGKKMVTIVAGALHDPEVFRPVNETFRLIADSLDFELVGQLTRPGACLLDFPLSKPMTLKRIEAAFVQAGRETVRAGRVTQETSEAAGASLASSAEGDQTMSKLNGKALAEATRLTARPRVYAPPPRRQTPRRVEQPSYSEPAEAPAPAPGPARDVGGSMGTVPGGSTFAVTLNQTLSTDKNAAGDGFTATVEQAVRGENGEVLIPAGATVHGRVTAVSKSNHVGEAAMISLAFESVTVNGRTYPMQATVEEAHPQRVTTNSVGRTAEHAAAGAAAGAILSKILGKSGTKGAILGAAAGTAIAMGSADVNAVLQQGSRVVIRTTGPVSVASR